jgi:hypothetical protein
MSTDQETTSQAVKPLGVSIKQAAELTGESIWQVKQKLRAGTYKAKKSGRRTIIIFSSIEKAWEALPAAKFQPPKPRKRRHEQRQLEHDTATV